MSYPITKEQKRAHDSGECPKAMGSYNCKGHFERNECGWSER